MSKNEWPAWYFGPGGARNIFERAEDVPDGWRDSPAHFEDEDAEGDVPADDTALRDEVSRLSDKLVAGLAELGYPADDATPVDRALFALAAVLDDREKMRAGLATMDGDGDGKPGGLSSERREIMGKLKDAKVSFSPTMTTTALRELLPKDSE